MLSIIAMSKSFEMLEVSSLDDISTIDILWYWVDFDRADEDEARYLDKYFNFHSLAIEDCLYLLQRPKVDYYPDHSFFILHSIDSSTLQASEVDLFVGENYVVSFHNDPSSEIDLVKKKIFSSKEEFTSKGHIRIAHYIMNKLVDNYFPAVYKIEDLLTEFDDGAKLLPTRQLIDRVFVIRGDLLKLRKSIMPMKELLYRILNSSHLPDFIEYMPYFSNTYDHLLKLSEIIESNYNLTSDIRDNYLAVNGDRMNEIMLFLTVITAIFVPLTFIVGIYGMNFSYMPELRWRYGYFIVLGAMTLIGVLMFLWFKKKGWFDTYK